MVSLCVAIAIWFLFFSAAAAEHTQATRKGEVQGLPPWCCDIRDCVPADVRLIRMQARWPIIEVGGKLYSVIGDYRDGRRGIRAAPGKQTFWCPLRNGKVRCATVKPVGQF
ncbi:MAG: hypothetical protein ACE5JS_06030 [Nitrospinota bacterium]